MMKIIADCNIPFVKECFSTLGEVEAVDGRQITAEIVRDANILVVRSVTKVDSGLLEGSCVKFVGTATIGFEHIDVDYLRGSGIGFDSAPGSNANSVAEYVVAALLEVSGRYEISLDGKSIGVVGVGNVGGKVAEKCRALGMEVVLNDPPLQRQTGEEKYRPIKEIFKCDFVTFHVPLTFQGIDKTYHLAGEKFFKSLKDNSVFINTSRGSVVDTAALKSALKSEKVKAVILDVWENEPSIDTELLEMTDIGTAHIAGYSFDGKVAGLMMIYDAVCRHFALAPNFHIGSLMPVLAVRKIRINKPVINEQNPVPYGAGQKQLLETVRQVYDIREDDGNLRQILPISLGRRCGIFDRLRREYRVRREFWNTEIVLEGNDSGFKNKLSGIGFRVSNG